MRKEVTLTFHLDADLKKQFIAAAKKKNMSASDVLRMLIQDFVQHNQKKSGAQILPEEQEKRREAVEFGHASVVLEGLKIPDQEKQHAERFISGEITLEEFITAPCKTEINATVLSRRIVELEFCPVQGKFDADHLKEIHRRIFQNLPVKCEDFSPGEFRHPSGRNFDWVKTRQLESVNAISNVAYSSMSCDVQNRLNEILSAIDIQNISMLDEKTFSKYMAELYIELDYIHPFMDGNSRALRSFTRQIAKEAGYMLHWEVFNSSPAGRCILYIARDISVNRIALPLAKADGTKRDITFTLDQLGNNRDMYTLMKDILERFAFEKDETRGGGTAPFDPKRSEKVSFA